MTDRDTVDFIRRQAKGLTVQGAYTWSKAINAADDEMAAQHAAACGG